MIKMLSLFVVMVTNMDREFGHFMLGEAGNWFQPRKEQLDLFAA